MSVSSKRVVFTRPSLRKDISYGIGGGLAMALVYCIWIALLYAVKGSEPFDSRGVSLQGLIALYVGGGFVGGAVFGALKPMSKSKLGARFLGAIALAPMMFALQILIEGTPMKWDLGAWLTVLVMASVLGWAVGGVFETTGQRESGK